MKEPKQTRQEYRTAKQEQSRRSLRMLAAFLAFFVLVGGLSALYYWRNAAPKLPEDTSTTQAETTSEPQPGVLGAASFFVYLKSTSGQADAAAIIRVDADAASASVRVLDAELLELLKQDDGLSSPAQCAISLKERKLSANRHIIIEERGFKDLVNSLGGLEITMEEKLDFMWDGAKRSLLKGKNLLRGESLLRYLQYLAQNGDTAAQGDIVCGLLSVGLNAKTHAKGEALFGELINYVKSDITAKDYVQSLQALDNIAEKGLRTEKSGG
ncbi:MAG: hypothetical protein LBQ80_03765 [Clostridium sp.]|jgi:hypothetical protein|nr:hypothetical protein [Clostridium sp.]